MGGDQLMVARLRLDRHQLDNADGLTPAVQQPTRPVQLGRLLLYPNSQLAYFSMLFSSKLHASFVTEVPCNCSTLQTVFYTHSTWTSGPSMR